jgi:hypothetical protein
MLDLDAAYQREQLLLEVLLDVRDALTTSPSQHAPNVDPLATIETIRRVTKLR